MGKKNKNKNKKNAIALITVDPSTPDNTVVGYSDNFDNPVVDPRGCPGAQVIGAFLDAGFEIVDVSGTGEYVYYSLINKNFSKKEQSKLSQELDNLNCEPVT